jgi:23S rRNA (adenine2030-N6)-methyltransferase
MSDYDHRAHVANHADVWKHCILLTWLAAWKRDRLTVVESHAGHGTYQLNPSGEWTAGFGKLVEALPPGQSTPSGAVDRYLARVRRLQRTPLTYPGSPALTLEALGRNDRLVLHELDERAAAALARDLGADPRVQVRRRDGWTAVEAVPETGRSLLVIDPPFVDTDEWDKAPDLLTAASQQRPECGVMLWYPVKSWTRPLKLLARLREAGTPFVAVDLVVTPVEIERRALAGSGVVLAGAPQSVITEVCAAAAVLGPLLSTHDGRWELRVTAG